VHAYWSLPPDYNQVPAPYRRRKLCVSYQWIQMCGFPLIFHAIRRCGTKPVEERHRAAHSRMDRISASGRGHQQHVPRPCYSPFLLHGTRPCKPDVGPEVFRMLSLRRYRYYLTRVWLNWLRSVTFDCLE